MEIDNLKNLTNEELQYIIDELKKQIINLQAENQNLLNQLNTLNQ